MRDRLRHSRQDELAAGVAEFLAITRDRLERIAS
jgi:2-oxo-4-hydroxy-4-carboxy--5-ureidoimidazoline (OHCU) decarboxylase